VGHRKTLDAVVSGTSDNNIRFSELTGMLRAMGFAERVRGSHHLYSRHGIREIIDLQPDSGMAKAYQVRQVRKIILEYKLTDAI